MSELFLTVLNMSFTASYVILVVMLARLLLKKTPKVISYVLWGVVAYRLIIPHSFESVFSLMPRNTNGLPIPHDIIYQQNPKIYSGIEVVDTFINKSLPAPNIGASVNPLQVYMEIGTYIWVLGIIALLFYSFVSILILIQQLKTAELVEQNIYEAKNLKTPFVLGLINPKIYLPVGLSEEEQNYILIHEHTHIHRKDHIIKILGFLILSIHWFNPLVWISFILMSTDMELSCDERVLKVMNEDIKKPYANSLLSLATGRHIINGSPLAFGEGSVRGRIKNVLNYRKPKFWIIIIVMIGAIAISFGLISNPSSITPSIMWAKSLKVEDIQSIELIVQPSSQTERYMKFKTNEYPEIVSLINQSNGRLIKNPEGIAGGAQTFYITTKDGDVHTVTNNGNIYLIIDADTFQARHNWLSKWDYKGNSNVPDGFLERVESKVSYSLMQLKNGEVQHSVSPLFGEDAKLAEEIIMSYLSKSAVWPGIDIKTCEECYLLRATYRDGTISDYYTFLHEGKAVMQGGNEGVYNSIDINLYNRLIELINKHQSN
jgi:beta-lactamase regulating signal transducer with metallopeptidase domain